MTLLDRRRNIGSEVEVRESFFENLVSIFLAMRSPPILLFRIETEGETVIS